MRFKVIIFFMGLLFNFHLFSQEYTWKLEQEYTKKGISSWDISPLEEIIFYSGRTLFKLDQNFNVLFSQGNTGFGDISNIDASHSLKILLFSENQQMLGFVDNTLSFQEGKIDVSELGVDYASRVCYSDQTNRFWVYDVQDSRLIRYQSTALKVKQTEISNLVAITKENELDFITESQNQLLLFYRNNGVFIFDYYGSLIRKFENKNAVQLHPSENHLYFLEEENIARINRVTGNELTLRLPYKGIEDFRISKNHVFFKDKDGIKKYSLVRKE